MTPGGGNASSISEIAGQELNLVMSAMVDSNAPGELEFRVPGTQFDPGSKLPVREAFDLTELVLNQNPSTTSITFTLANGSTSTVTLNPGETVATAPADVVGYTVQVMDIPSTTSGATAAQRTFELTAKYKLRATERTSGDRIVPADQQRRDVAGATDFTHKVAAAAPGQANTMTKSVNSGISVTPLLPVVTSDVKVKTESGESTSVYGSTEPSTTTIRFANSGQQKLSELKVTVPQAGAWFFDYNDMTASPGLQVKFPAGATSAKIQYIYKDGTGAERSFTSTGPVPAPTLDSIEVGGVPTQQTHADVIGFVVTFSVPAGNEGMDNECAIADGCAGEIVLPAKLRTTHRTTGDPVQAPATGNVNTEVRINAAIEATATTKSSASFNTSNAILTLVPAQLQINAGKRFGDGSNNVTYPLDGSANAGNLFDPTLAEGQQNFSDHTMRLSVSTRPTEGSAELAGAPQFTLSDPQDTPTLAKIKDQAFNFIELTALDTSPAVCVVPETDPVVVVPSTSTQKVWLVDDVDNVTAITEKDVTAALTADELERVVGLQVVIKPVAPESRFPAHVRCGTGENTKAKFRNYTLEKTAGDNPARKAVTPQLLANALTPGLFRANNTLRVTTGVDRDQATAAASLSLVDLSLAVMYKQYDKDAKKYGVESQGTPTSFVLSAVPQGENVKKLEILDQSTPAEQGFDLLDVTAIRAPKVGPDQKMTIELFDEDGVKIDTGVIEASTKNDKGEEIDADDIENSQSAAYVKFWKDEDNKRVIEWSTPSAPPSKADLAKVAKILVTSERGTAGAHMQKYGAVSLVIDAALRDTFRSDPSKIVVGSTAGVSYSNIGTSTSTDASNNKVEKSSPLGYKVYAPTEMIGKSNASWLDASGHYDPLVAEAETVSTIVLDATNRTVVGVSDTIAKEDRWKDPQAIPIGVDQLSVQAGDTPESGRNPFAIVNFAGVEQVYWPRQVGIKSGTTKPADHVNAKITYLFSSGAPETIDVPYNTPVEDMNPTPSRWKDVVGVSMTWHEDGKWVGIEENSTNANRARLLFKTVLRNDVRTGFEYGLLDENGAVAETITSLEPIVGPPKDVRRSVTVDNHATLATLEQGTSVPQSTLPIPSTSLPLSLERQQPFIDYELKVTPAPSPGRSQLYRDLPNQGATWSYGAKNTSNTPVASMWLTTDCRLLAASEDCHLKEAAQDRTQWPTGLPSSFPIEGGSIWDSFNATGAGVRFPAGAVTAKVWALGEDLKWTDEMQVTSVTPAVGGLVPLTLPSTGEGPKTWDKVIAFRAQFDGDLATGQRIAITKNGPAAALEVKMALRDTLRTNPDEKAPGTDIVSSSGASWFVGAEVFGTLNVGKNPTATEGPAPHTPPVRDLQVYAGAPAPKIAKYFKVTAQGGFETTGEAFAGETTDFYVRIWNTAAATSSLYHFDITDVLPEGLIYDPMNPVTVTEASRDSLKNPKFTVVGQRKVKATWDPEETLKPGEFVTIKVPLRVEDGFAAGQFATNLAYIGGKGITNAADQGICMDSTELTPNCNASATLTSLRGDRVRVESFLDASLDGAVDADNNVCLSGAGGSAPECADKWLTAPWRVVTTVGNTDIYRVKLVNAGNIALSDIRFVNGIPFEDDKGVLLNKDRKSEWQPKLVPGSIKIIGNEHLDDVTTASRSDVSFAPGSLRYTTDEKPCQLGADSNSSRNTLACATGNWTNVEPGDGDGPVKAFGADISFPADKPFLGGDYVIVEYKVTIPETNPRGTFAFSSATMTGRQSAQAAWLDARESFNSGLRTVDAAITVTKKLTADEVSNWHLKSNGYELELSCVSPDGTAMDPIAVKLPAIVEADGTVSKVVRGVPVDGKCKITDETYVPTATTAPDQYGVHSDNVTGYTFTTDPEGEIEPLPYIIEDGNAIVPAENAITVTNKYTAASLTIGVDLAGNATDVIRPDDEFKVDVTCDFGDVTKKFDSLMIKPGKTATINNIAVGANCEVTETDARGATPVTGQYEDGPVTDITDQRTVSVATVEAGDHSVKFVNHFNQGGDLVVTKRVELPKSGTAIGDVELATSCVLAGHELNLGDKATQTLTFGAGETEKSFTVAGVPTGAECTVTETAAGGANVPAPDRTVTIHKDETVYVEMTNIFTPATLSLTKELAGAGAKESRVPSKFDVQATCTRDLIIGGKDVTVTDHDAKIALTPGAPINVAKLPAGSQCEITEPYKYQAESTKFESLTKGVENLSKDDTNSAVVVLAEANANGDAVTTAVRVTNSYKKTEGLVITGGAAAPFGAAALLLLAGLGIVLFRKRRTGEAS